MTVPYIKRAAGLWLGLVIFAILLMLGWVGFIGSDDASYIGGAYGWRNYFPYVGGHGTIRYPITIPIALSVAVLGAHEFVLVLPTIAYATAIFIMVWRLVARAVSPLAAFMALLLLATSPLLVIQSTVASADITEACFLIAAFYMFWHCYTGQRPVRHLFWAGVWCGFAFLTRETASLIAPFYMACLAVAWWQKKPAVQYCAYLLLGFVTVWGAELLYLYSMTGDPFYRIHIALHHDTGINRTIDLAGNVLLHPAIDPLLVLLLNQEFMLLFWVTLPMGAWCYMKRAQFTPQVRRFVALFSGMGVMWLASVGAAQHLLPLNARYFMLCTIAACVLTGIVLAHWWQSHRILTRVLLCALLSSNVLGIFAENKDIAFAEKMLPYIVQQHHVTQLHTDPTTLFRANVLLKLHHMTQNVNDDTPRSGDYYLHNPHITQRIVPNSVLAQKPVYQPTPQWQVVQSYAPNTLFVKFMLLFKLQYVLPQRVVQKILQRAQPITLYKVLP